MSSVPANSETGALVLRTMRRRAALGCVVMLSAGTIGCRNVDQGTPGWYPIPPASPSSAALPVPTASPAVVAGLVGEKSPPALAIDPRRGNALMTWMQVNADTTGLVVYAQRLREDGTDDGLPVKSATGLPYLSRPAVACEPLSGRFLVTWIGSVDGRYRTFGLWLGTNTSEPFTISEAFSGAAEPLIACADQTSDCLVSWWDLRNSSGIPENVDTYGQRLPATVDPGAASLAIATGIGNQKVTGVAVDAKNHAFVAVWPDFQRGEIGLARVPMSDAESVSVQALSVRLNGQAIGYPRVAVDAATGARLIVWVTAQPAPPTLMAQLVDSQGQPISAAQALVSGIKADRPAAVHSMGAGNGFAVLWNTFRYEAAGTGVRPVGSETVCQLLTSAGLPVGTAITVANDSEQPCSAYDVRTQRLMTAWLVENKTAIRVRVQLLKPPQ